MSNAGIWDDPVRNLMMLWDIFRIDSYRRVIEPQASNRVLLEIGCGHGVLACLAARAGARRVYAVEQASVIEAAREVARRSGVGGIVEFIRGNSLDVDLPERADVVFFDLMGADPLGAGMLKYADDAAKRFLKSGGVLVPQRLTLLAVGIESRRTTRETAEAAQWLCRAEALSDRFKLDLSPLIEASREAFSRSYDAFSYKAYVEGAGVAEANDRVLTSEVVVAEFDMANLTPERPVRRSLSLPVVAAGVHNAMATYCAVGLNDSITLTTSPFASERPAAWGGQFVSTLHPAEVSPGAPNRVEAEVTPWTTPAVRYWRVGSADPQTLFAHE